MQKPARKQGPTLKSDITPSLTRGLPQLCETYVIRSRIQPHPSPDALPVILRNVPERDKKHVDGRGSRFLDRRDRSACEDDSGRAALDQSPRRVFCHWRFDRGKQPRAKSLQAYKFARGPDVPFPSTL